MAGTLLGVTVEDVDDFAIHVCNEGAMPRRRAGRTRANGRDAW